jgi:hypothetical protein
MNDAILSQFRALAEAMTPEPQDWQWIGPHMSQRMFGIAQARAEAYAKRHGGIAKRMEAKPMTDKLKAAFETAIACWDRRNRNHHAGAIALLRLDEAMAEITAGRDVLETLRDCFNDRLLVALEKAYAEVRP